MLKKLICIPLILFSICLITPTKAYSDNFSAGLGVIVLGNPSRAEIELGAEYEYRIDALFGLGGDVSYIFSDPGIFELGVPEAFLHPLGNDWVISASPLFAFVSGAKTEVGARFGTRVPLPMGAFTIVPAFTMDFIGGAVDYGFGFGISI